MAYTENKNAGGLDTLTNLTVASGDLFIVGDISDTNRAKALTLANLETKVASDLNLSGTNTGDQTNITGNAGTATALQNARTIGGVSFDGTGNIVPQTIQSVNEATDTTCFPLFISASGSQSLQPLNNTSLTFNSNTATLGSTIFNAGTGFQIAGAATSNKILKANGTNFVASTETYATPGTSGNVMTSDGTNWTSATPSGGTLTANAAISSGPATSSTQTITHGLGRTPVNIDLYGYGPFLSNASGEPLQLSIGFYSALAGNLCITMQPVSGNQNPTTSTSGAIILFDGTANQATGVVGNITSTTFDIVWTLTGATVAAAKFIWKVQ